MDSYAVAVDSNPSPSSDLSSTHTTTADTTSSNTTSNVISHVPTLATIPSSNVSTQKAVSGVAPSNVTSTPRAQSPPTLSASSASASSLPPRRPPSANQNSETQSNNQRRNQTARFSPANQGTASQSPSFTHSLSETGKEAGSGLVAPPRAKTALVTPMGSEVDGSKPEVRRTASRIPTRASRSPSSDAHGRRHDADDDIPATLL